VSLSVHLTPAPPKAQVAVVIDVLRFTSSAAYALGNGARSIIPCASVEEARSTVGKLPRTARLAGERKAQRPEGFDFGNSPLEFTATAVQGRDLVWTTTNGTQAIAAVLRGDGAGEFKNSPLHPSHTLNPSPSLRGETGRDLLLASYVNLTAVTALLEPLLRVAVSVAFVCSGREGGFALEDAACAGRLVNRLRARLGDVLTIDDAARACATIDEAYGEDCARCFRDAQHGRTLRELGFGPDLEACGALDAVQIVPRWRDGRFVAG
jgi:2-phosphosulfolactate phosphatase